MAARWRELGRGPPRTPPGHGRAGRRDDHGPRHVRRQRRRDRHPARGHLHGPRRRRDRRHRDASTSPTSSTTSAAIGTVLEVVPGPESLRWFGTGPHETYPDRKRAGSSASGSRPSPTSTSRTSGRRRTAVTPTSAGWSSARRARSRPPDRPRRAAPGLRHPPPRCRPGGRDPRRRPRRPSPRRSSTSMPPIAAWAPRAAARTRCPSTCSRPAGTSGAGPCATSRATDPCRSPGRRRPATSTSATTRSATSCGSTTTGASATCISAGRWRTAGSSHRSSPAASPASRTASATRSGSSTRRRARGDFRIPALTVEHADGSTVLALAYADHRIVPGKPGWADGDLPDDLRRGRRRGRHARGHARGPGQRPRGRPRLHDLPRPSRDRPERPDPQRRGRAGPADRRS